MSKLVLENPIIWADVPDVDVLRDGENFYLISTSMHSMPGCPIMKSTDLVHWCIVTYVFDIIGDADEYNLVNGRNIYGQGSWAPSIRYHNGMYYVMFNCHDMGIAFIYSTNDIENGVWRRVNLGGMYFDPSLLFVGDTPYIINGCGEIYINRLKDDLSGIAEDPKNGLLFVTPRESLSLRCEGCHAYFINGWFYLLFIEWTSVGNKRRRVKCYRSKELYGPYESKVVLDDDMGYHNCGIAHGALFDTPDGRWFAMMGQDHGAVGRTPCVIPVTWIEEWPILGVDGAVPKHIELPFEAGKGEPVTRSDEFDYTENQLLPQWQWNHNPDHEHWSFTEHPGYLRLTNGTICEDGVIQARNTLTQRTEGPQCSGETHILLQGLKPGDCAGLMALQGHFGMIGVRIAANGKKQIVVCVNGGEYCEREDAAVDFEGDEIYLKVKFDFRDNKDTADFYYSADNMIWTRLGERLQLIYDLDHFMGCRFGLFCYAAAVTDGYADFDYFRYQKEIKE